MSVLYIDRYKLHFVLSVSKLDLFMEIFTFV